VGQAEATQILLHEVLPLRLLEAAALLHDTMRGEERRSSCAYISMGMARRCQTVCPYTCSMVSLHGDDGFCVCVCGLGTQI
jgi:HD superfamily phosphodiesterase